MDTRRVRLYAQRPMVFPYSLSVFFPAYNDARSLPGLIGATFEVLAQYVDDVADALVASAELRVLTLSASPGTP